MRAMWRGLAASLAVAVLAAASASGSASAEDKVSLTLDWVLNGTHAGYFVAREKGYYKDAGLEVTISRGFGSGDTVKRVGSGATDFGVADTGAIIAARANGDVPVHIVAMIYDRATLGLIYLKGSGIRTPKDLEGRTLARSASGASVNMLPGFLKANSVDRSKITELVVDGATYLPLLLSGKADAVTEQAINIGKFTREARKLGKEAVPMLYSDYGLEAYGNALIVQDSAVKAKGALIARFTEASLRGLAYAMAHPDEAVAILRATNPEIGAEGATDELGALKDINATDDVRKNGLGSIDKRRMEATRDTVTEALGLKRKVPVEEIYTDELLPKTPVRLE